MKVAYCLIYASTTENSVQRKIKQQIEALNQCGTETNGFFFTFDPAVLEKNCATSEKITFDYIGPYPGGWFQALKAKKLCYKKFQDWLYQNEKYYDAIYVRYHLSSPSFYKVVRKYGHKIGIEFQTKNIPEIRSFYRNNPFGLTPSKLLSWLEHQFIPIFNEQTWGRLVLGKTRFIVGVTHEILQYEYHRAIGKKPFPIMVANGIEVNATAVRPIPPYDGKILKLVMLVGSVKGSDWNGIDLIVQGIQNYKGPVKIELYLCGDMESNHYQELDFVIPMGYLKGEELEKITRECHLALGAFALSRKKIKEGSTLKFREYMAKGIPVVYGYDDTDGDLLAQKELALKLEADQVPDFEQIISFAENIYQDNGHAKKIREFALEQVDFKVKMEQLATAIEETLKN